MGVITNIHVFTLGVHTTGVTVGASLVADADRSTVDQALADIERDGRPIADDTGSSATDRWSFELRVDSGATLRRFHRVGAERGIVLDVRRIRSERDGIDTPVNDRSAAAEDDRPDSVRTTDGPLGSLTLRNCPPNNCQGRD